MKSVLAQNEVNFDNIFRAINVLTICIMLLWLLFCWTLNCDQANCCCPRKDALCLKLQKSTYDCRLKFVWDKMKWKGSRKYITKTTIDSVMIVGDLA